MKKLFLTIIIILVVATIAYAGYILSTRSGEPTPQEEQVSVVEDAPARQQGVRPPINRVQVTPTVQQDQDNDGLSDQEEQEIGTQGQNADSDNDGLSDFEEVRIYGTDPLNPDTDGDGFEDGSELEQGFNPKGEGRLLDIQRALQDQQAN